MPKNAVGRPHGVKTRSLPRARRKSGYRAESPNRQLSFILERNKIDVAQLENSAHANFPLCDVYFVMRSAKQKMDNNLVVWIVSKTLFKRLNYVHFHISVGRTLKRAKLAKPDYFYSCFVHFISFPNGRCSRHLRSPCPIYENWHKTTYLIFHVKQKLNVPIC